MLDSPLWCLDGGDPLVSLVQLGPFEFDPKNGPPCHDCTAKCCKYFALQIDTPTTPKDHDHIRWYLLHEHIAVWVQTQRCAALATCNR